MNSHIEKNYDIDTKPLKYFLYYLFLGFCIFLAGITGVFASEYNFDSFTAKFYDNNGSSLSALITEKDDTLGYLSQKVYMTANSTGAGIVISSPTPFISGHSYSVSLSMQTYGNNALVSNRFTFSSVNRIAISNNENGVLTNYINNNTYTTISYSNKTSDMLQFVFKATGNGNYIFIPFATTISATYQFGIKTFVVDDLGNNPTQNDINNSLNSQTNIITNNFTSGINDVKDSINDSFNDCKENLFNPSNISKGWVYYIDNVYQDPYNETFYTTGYIPVNGNTLYTINFYNSTSLNSGGIMQYDLNKNWLGDGIAETSTIMSFTTKPNAKYVRFVIRYDSRNNVFFGKGSSSTFIPFGDKQCTNKIDDTNNKLDEAENTRKGILGTLKDVATNIINLPKKIVELIVDGLKSLFIPSDDFFSSWWENFSSFFKKKLGFLTSPIEIFINFISAYLNLDSSSDIIINIPDIHVPNFEEYSIVSAQSFNWSELLNSKDSLKFLWTLYLDFIDVFIILNFIALCENTYNRIFGGDTTNYEYYTTQISYDVDPDNNQVSNTHKKFSKTTRKKADT